MMRLVGKPYYLNCVSEDRWGRPFKHPYVVEGFTGTIESTLFDQIERFTHYVESEEAKAELRENSKNHVGAWDSSTIERLAPKMCAEIKNVLGPQQSLIWQFNVQTGPDTYVRYFAVFKEPSSGVRPVTSYGQAIRYGYLRAKAYLLNLLGTWKQAPYPTLAEIETSDAQRVAE